MDKFGPFASIIAAATFLVAAFGGLTFKMLGPLKGWADLTDSSPPFLVAGAARLAAVALIAVAFLTITPQNYLWFAAAAVVTGVLGLLAVVRFDQLRKIHIVRIPIVARDGSQRKDQRGKPESRGVVIGLARELKPQTAEDYRKAQERHGSLSLAKFMSGYGKSINDPEALWDREVLAGHSNRLTTMLIYVVLTAAVTLFLAAASIDIGT